MKIKSHRRYQYAEAEDPRIIVKSPAAAAIERRRRKNPVREARRQALLSMARLNSRDKMLRASVLPA